MGDRYDISVDIGEGKDYTSQVFLHGKEVKWDEPIDTLFIKPAMEEAKKVNDEWEKSRARHDKLIDKLRAKLMEGGFLDDTRDKVYELNRQMCDLGIPLRNPIEPISEEAAQELIGKYEKIGKEWDSKKDEIVLSIFKGIENQIKERDMEKKTKKMTKAEAFEWLKCKKIDSSCLEIGIQNKLFSIGIEWRTMDTKFVDCVPYLLINAEGKMSHCGKDANYWFSHCYEAISAEDILSIVIVEECAKDDEDPYFGGRIKDLQEMIEDDEVLIITKTNFLTMTK